ncbi:uncharacterized protein TRIADDRAFT_19174 [Trichoplax adhaerens]|uniref:Nbr1 FW domain-containing protein n=1 Tax=Trichoplax adhaerens TaxID=10228 RepID=B3RLV0_TRIAD|nr:hypothetical protein TRIADDRAFT_19174 [Trichoplax adhaerens]EDV28850.1 hypothetical protein TRIADDRAFT_19174 [Trichoplax adhaerens]|eukprot:XP_002108052.1 hypothetical protein TRIADDRAFT_19174 [Trichoplax adhaerens]
MADDLMQKFSVLGTTDHDILIKQLQEYLNYQLSPSGCEFFLDMNNWNLQLALGSYFDYNAPTEYLPSMTFIQDVTIGEGESVQPNTQFVKTWRIQNSGQKRWPDSVRLRFIGGDQLGPSHEVRVQSHDAQEIGDVSVVMISPNQPGTFQGRWRMATQEGLFFGDIIWVIISVENSGLLGLTQQLSYINTRDNGETTMEHHDTTDFNPFGRVGATSTEAVFSQQASSSYPTLIKPQSLPDEDVSSTIPNERFYYYIK